MQDDDPPVDKTKPLALDSAEAGLPGPGNLMGSSDETLESWDDFPRARRPLLARDLSSRRRRIWLPALLFFATCLSTWWAGASYWEPFQYVGFGGPGDSWRGIVLQRHHEGFVYMACVVGILLAHEMGHYVATLIYRIPASLPYFIPFPLAPIGTMGAVIGMEGFRANRRQIFDIGLAGPIAGLIIAAPILWLGVARLDLSEPGRGNYRYDCPLVARWMIARQHPDHAEVTGLQVSQMNPYFVAGWVGLLITGLNMLPVSQLDGGHVTYTLFGKKAHWIARLFVAGAVFYMLFSRTLMWGLMLLLVLVIGTDHPPTANDRVPLGWPRAVLGFVSLSIPILCFPPRGLWPVP